MTRATPSASTARYRRANSCTDSQRPRTSAGRTNRSPSLRTGYVVATVGFLIVITWALTPLLIPGLGCAALAVVAIPGRPRKSED